MATIAKTEFKRNTCVFIILCHFAFAMFINSRGSYEGAYFWAAIFIMVASLPYVMALFTKKFILYESIYLFMTGFAFSHTANLLLPPDEIVQSFSSIAQVMKLATLGILSVVLGYKFRLGQKLASVLPLKNFIIKDEELLKIPNKFYFLWVILVMLPRWNVQLPGNVSAMISSLQELLIFAALMTDTYLYFSRTQSTGEGKLKKKHLLRITFFLCIYIAESVLSGFGGKIATPFILIYLVYIKIKKRIAIGPLIAICIAVIMFLTYVIPFTKAFRTDYRKSSSVKTAFDAALTETRSEDPRDGLEQSLIRFSHPLGMAIICFELREKGGTFSFYNNIVDFMARFIPRFIWPNKPISFDWNTLGREMGLLQPTDYTTAVGLPLLASLILNGGAVSVVIGMFFVGVILKIWWHWLMVRSGENFLTFSIYLILMISWMFGGDEIRTILVYNTMFLSYTYIFLGLIKRRTR